VQWIIILGLISDWVKPRTVNLDNKTITQAMSGVDSSMEWKEKKKHLEAAGITPRNIPTGPLVCQIGQVLTSCTI
jgi:hypothetical protein